MTANEIKFIKKLQQKKYRFENKQYIIEGNKLVTEAIANCPDKIDQILTTKSLNDYPKSIKVSEIGHKEMERITALKSASEVLAVMKMMDLKEISQGNSLYLEDIKDPGNMGTIIRTADWFGISNIYFSKDCVDIYNPKVIQATMGSFFRVNLVKKDIIDLADENLVGATLNGELIDESDIPEDFCLVIGNESKGISESTLKLLNSEVKIPGFGKAESLNASIASGILMYAFSRPKN